MSSRVNPRRFILALCAFSFFAASGAEACNIWRDENGFFRGNCKLSAIFKDRYVAEVAFLADDARYRLRLVDLHPRKFKFYTIDRSVEVYVDIQNLGSLTTRAVEAPVMLNITNPLNANSSVGSTNVIVQAPALAAGTEQRLYVATLTLPDRNQDWDITSVVMVDPPTAASPIWGASAESDETNNSLSNTCRVYGPNPDTTVSVCN